MKRPPSDHRLDGPVHSEEVRIETDSVTLDGTLTLPPHPLGLVIFAHGSGSSRFSSRNRHVARELVASGLGTLLFDLLTRSEEAEDEFTGHLRFDIPLLASRLEAAARWTRLHPSTAETPLGYFGASTGAAAALIAAARGVPAVGAVVSRGGRPDLAGEALTAVRAPTLLIVGGSDDAVLPLNEQAYTRLLGEKRLEIVPGATHLFEEPGALDLVAKWATAWFRSHLAVALHA